MPRLKTTRWSSEDHLTTADDVIAYLEAAFEDGDPALITHSLGVVARSRGMTALARDTGLGRQNLYKALSSEGHPAFETILEIVRALGLKLTVTTA